jgi:transposase
MGKRISISDEEIVEIEAASKRNKDKNIDNRLEALLLHSQGIKHSVIAERTGFVKSYITELVQKYRKHGLGSIVDNHYRGNHRKLSFSDEEELLKPYKKAAASGQIVDISEIKKAYESATGCSLENNHGQIYRVLKRHGWRKVMPRSKHPNKASDEAIDASKKLTVLSRANWKILQMEK